MTQARSGLVIVKVQLPLLSTEANPGALVYEGSRKRGQTIMDLPPRVLALMNGDLKAYFRARPRPGGWNILTRVSDQPW
jgi:hypothetical protein